SALSSIHLQRQRTRLHSEGWRSAATCLCWRGLWHKGGGQQRSVAAAPRSSVRIPAGLRRFCAAGAARRSGKLSGATRGGGGRISASDRRRGCLPRNDDTLAADV